VREGKGVESHMMYIRGGFLNSLRFLQAKP
jgi:hypothetical protein